MTEVYACPVHGCKQAMGSYCGQCKHEFDTRRDVMSMTAEERATELERWVGILTIPFADLHLRVTELVGRDVYTHEMARPEQLAAEVRSGRLIGMDAVIAKLTDRGINVVLLDAEDAEHGEG